MAQRAKSCCRGLTPRLLFMSGYSDEAVSRHGALRPGVPFVPKPFTASTLLRRVHEALHGRLPSACP